MGADRRALIAEFIGTFGLIFMGAGAIIVDSHTGGRVGIVGIALAHGLAIFLGVAFSAHLSGGHLNPAVTAGFLVTKRLSLNDGVAYMAAQLLGGIVAAIALQIVTPRGAAVRTGLGTPVPGQGVDAFHALVVEFILTFFLVFVIFGTAVDPRGPKAIFPLCIGMAVTMDILAGGPLTGASMNPARSFG
ncbi:MAG TPA: aquaporin, partial [Candidatus Methylomirabilis sp.]